MSQTADTFDPLDTRDFLSWVARLTGVAPEEAIPIGRYLEAGGVQTRFWHPDHIDPPMPNWVESHSQYSGHGPYTHYSCSLQVRGPGKPTFRRDSSTRPWVVLFDDVGTKCAPVGVVPSYKVETSPGNQQWGFLLQRPEWGPPRREMRDIVAALLRVAVDKKMTDKNGANLVRLARLPGSRPLMKPHRARLIHQEDVVFEAADLARQLGINLDDGAISVASRRRSGGSTSKTDPSDAEPELIVDHHSQKYWFNSLTGKQRAECAMEMVMALPRRWAVNRDDWRRVGTALRSQGAWLLWDVFEAFSRRGGNYRPDEDCYLFTSGKIGNEISIASLIFWAEEAGWDGRAWKKLAWDNGHFTRNERFDTARFKFRL